MGTIRKTKLLIVISHGLDLELQVKFRDPSAMAAVMAVNPARNHRSLIWKSKSDCSFFNGLIPKISDDISSSPSECDLENKKQKIERKPFH